MFIWGLVVGLATAALIGMILNRRRQESMAAMERTRSSQFRRITALEKELAEVKARGAAAVRDEKLRNAREFSQYKTLLRRADAALSQARSQSPQEGDHLSEAA